MADPSRCLLPIERQTGRPSGGGAGGPGAQSAPLVTSAPVALGVTNEVKQVLPGNPSRRFLLIQNQSPFAWRISYGIQARPGFGLLLLPGQVYRESGDAVPTSAVFLVGELGTAPGYPGAGLALEG